MFTETDTQTNRGQAQSGVPAIPNKSLSLDKAIAKAQAYLLDLQTPEGYWLFELEADCSIPAEYVIMMHYIGDVDLDLQEKIACYLRAHQSSDGSYPLFSGGEGDLSCSIKVYYALKMAGDRIEAPHMVTLRNYILSHGGAARANMFTRITLAIFEQLSWRSVPFTPVEIMLLPKWSPLHVDKISYWSRTVLVPLSILCALEAKAKNPNQIHIPELFLAHPDKKERYYPTSTFLNKCFLVLERIGSAMRPLIPTSVHERAIVKAKDWIIVRLNGEDGLGGIFPAMVNAYEALLLLGIPADDPSIVTARKAIDKLLVIREHEAYCQPCLSPVWDTGLAALTLQEVDRLGNRPALTRAYDWLKNIQLSDEPGDWRTRRPHLPGGGWAFQFANPHYPDVDDTSVVAFGMAESGIADLDESIQRATRWICGMQSYNGGYGAFDVDNTYYYLNEIPFADNGPLIDPPSVDVSARCAMLMARLAKGYDEHLPALERTIAYIRSEQEENGSWFGRWGTNYIYGTWSVLLGLERTNISKTDPVYTKAVDWLKNIQNTDGGWGESNKSYDKEDSANHYLTSTAFQTALAVIALCAAGEAHSAAVKSGVSFLLRKQHADGVWYDDSFNAPGFPKVFYLKYHGYDKYFPLWALARYRNELAKQ